MLPDGSLTTAIVLAAGEGTRMHSAIPKVLHPLAGRPLVEHAVRAAAGLGPEHLIVVIGHGRDAVDAHLRRVAAALGREVRPAVQAHQHAMVRPDCRSCGGRCHAKGWRPHRIATLFGEVRVKLPRLACTGCGCGGTGVSWPSHCRSTPGLDELQPSLACSLVHLLSGRCETV